MVCPYQTASVTTTNVLDGARAVYFQTPLGAPPARGFPAVVVFQGSLSNSSQYFSGSQGDGAGRYAQAAMVKGLLDAGYAVIAPQAALGGSTFWDTNVPPFSLAWTLAPDHRVMIALLGQVAAGTFGPIDATRRFAAGFSSGAYMTSRMAVSYAGTFRALVIESGSYATCLGPLCAIPALPADHPPTLFLHGGTDPVVPPWTMNQYDAALVAQGTETRVVVDSTAGHQWIDAAPGEVLSWIRAHDVP